jgi:hypothetical protein
MKNSHPGRSAWLIEEGDGLRVPVEGDGRRGDRVSVRRDGNARAVPLAI